MGEEQYKAETSKLCEIAAHDYKLWTLPVRAVDERLAPGELLKRIKANEDKRRAESLWPTEAMTVGEHETYWATVLVECPDYLISALPRPEGFGDAIREPKR